MKLPQERSERIKLVVLFAIVAVIALYFLADRAIRPMLERRAGRRQQIEQLRSDLETVHQVMTFVSHSKEVNRRTVDEILQISETNNCVLKARLGNYVLEATELVEQYAQEAGVPLKTIREVGIADLPSLARELGSSVFRLYTLRVEAECGIHELIRLLRVLEESNPYLCIVALSITAQPASPDVHDAVFDVQWLIWKDEVTLARVREAASAWQEAPP